VWEYVLSIEQAYECMEVQPERLALIGHSHVALFFTRLPEDGGPGETHGDQAEDGLRVDLGGGRWLLNPGSVGQPRDGDPRAAWLELDTKKLSARFHRVAYDIDRAAASIVEAGLPKRLADRLYIGQ
jgi:diadenosine tetraphosphatase ApaH/serine/threonine PP2A family protein phosphatase